MPQLSLNERHQATRFILTGESQSEIARRLGVAQSTISRLHERLDTTGTTSDRPRSGRPRETTLRQDCQIRLIHLRNRFKTSVETAATIPGRQLGKTCYWDTVSKFNYISKLTDQRTQI